jgi:hypothetical protein
MKRWRLLIAGTILTVAAGLHSGDVKAAPCHLRACKILQRQATQPWVCPQTPSGRVVVSREVCFVLNWPEPTL